MRFARDNYADSQDFEILIQYSSGGGSPVEEIEGYPGRTSCASSVAMRKIKIKKKRARNPHVRSPYPIKYTHRGPRSFVTGAPRLRSHKSVHLGKREREREEEGKRTENRSAVTEEQKRERRHDIFVW